MGSLISRTRSAKTTDRCVRRCLPFALLVWLTFAALPASALSAYSVESSFGSGGITGLDFDSGSTDLVGDAVRQPDGKLVIAGSASNADFSVQKLAVARFNANGSLDDGGVGDSTPLDAFGTGGKTVLPLAPTRINGLPSVALQADGRIVVGAGLITGGVFDFGVFRFNANGSLDDGTAGDATPGDAFGGDGRVDIDVSSGSFDGQTLVEVQPSGRIVAAGTSAGKFAAVRLNSSDGSLDSGGAGDATPGDAFGTAGKTTIDFPGAYESVNATALHPDGRIVLAGSAQPGSTNDFALARLTVDGAPDTSFNGGDAGNTTGRITTPMTGMLDSANTVFVEPDNKITAAGTAQTAESNQDLAFVRYLENGALNTAFSGDGIHIKDAGGAGDEVTATAPGSTIYITFNSSPGAFPPQAGKLADDGDDDIPVAPITGGPGDARFGKIIPPVTELGVAALVLAGYYESGSGIDAVVLGVGEGLGVVPGGSPPPPPPPTETGGSDTAAGGVKAVVPVHIATETEIWKKVAAQGHKRDLAIAQNGGLIGLIPGSKHAREILWVLGKDGVPGMGTVKDVADTIGRATGVVFYISSYVEQGWASDPPRFDFDRLAKPKPAPGVRFKGRTGRTKALAKALNALATNASRLLATGRAFTTTFERVQGAVVAGNAAAESRQARHGAGLARDTAKLFGARKRLRAAVDAQARKALPGVSLKASGKKLARLGKILARSKPSSRLLKALKAFGLPPAAIAKARRDLVRGVTAKSPPFRFPAAMSNRRINAGEAAIARALRSMAAMLERVAAQTRS